jgi:putative oxidoreductase
MRMIATWVLTVLLALAFFGAGLAKLTSQPMMVHEFSTFGLPLWFLYVTGSLEVIGAVLVLIPRLAFIGTSLICCIMVGALIAHLTHGQSAMIGAPLVLLVLAIVVGSLRGWGRTAGLQLSNAA